MKVPFSYQATEYDCVPICFTNALKYLYEREEIPPAIIKRLMMYSLDAIDENGEYGKYGTTGEAIERIMQWLGTYSKDKFAVKAEYLPQEQIHLRRGNKIISCINRGGIALLRVCLDKKGTLFHYILSLGIDETDSDWLLFHDPLYRVNPFIGEDKKHIELLGGNSRQGANLRIRRERLDLYEYAKYSLGTMDERECCLLERL